MIFQERGQFHKAEAVNIVETDRAALLEDDHIACEQAMACKILGPINVEAHIQRIQYHALRGIILFGEGSGIDEVIVCAIYVLAQCPHAFQRLKAQAAGFFPAPELVDGKAILRGVEKGSFQVRHSGGRWSFLDERLFGRVDRAVSLHAFGKFADVVDVLPNLRMVIRPEIFIAE